MDLSGLTQNEWINSFKMKKINNKPIPKQGYVLEHGRASTRAIYLTTGGLSFGR